MNVVVKPIITAGVRKLEAGLQRNVTRAIYARTNAIANRAQRALEASTTGWSEPPTFHKSGSAASGLIEISTTDRKFGWVDDGVAPHPINARGRAMRFPENYQAKTTPRRVLRGSGRYSGGMVYTRHVNHPGIKPRQITKIIAEQTQRNLREEIPPIIKAAIG